MTRINALIPVQKLCNKHLLAEHREIKRIPNVIKSGKFNLHGQPKSFTLGTGHVKFFYDKQKFLYNRYIELYNECVARGFSMSNYAEAWDGLENHEFWNDWTPSADEHNYCVTELTNRINDRSPVKEFTVPLGFSDWHNLVDKGESLLLGNSGLGDKALRKDDIDKDNNPLFRQSARFGTQVPNHWTTYRNLALWYTDRKNNVGILYGSMTDDHLINAIAYARLGAPRKLRERLEQELINEYNYRLKYDLFDKDDIDITKSYHKMVNAAHLGSLAGEFDMLPITENNEQTKD